jgi:hypothetical protein
LPFERTKKQFRRVRFEIKEGNSKFRTLSDYNLQTNVASTLFNNIFNATCIPISIDEEESTSIDSAIASTSEHSSPNNPDQVTTHLKSNFIVFSPNKTLLSLPFVNSSNKQTNLQLMSLRLQSVVVPERLLLLESSSPQLPRLQVNDLIG